MRKGEINHWTLLFAKEALDTLRSKGMQCAAILIYLLCTRIYD